MEWIQRLNAVWPKEIRQMIAMHSRNFRFAVVLISLFFLCVSTLVSAQSDQGLASRQFGIGQPQSIEDLPPGQLKRRLQSLPPQASAKALKWLQDMEFTGADLDLLWVDDQGGVLFVDTFLPDPEQAEQAAAAGIEEAPVATLDDAFLLHSRPGAPNVVFLDFDGHTFSNTAWGSGTYQGKPYDLDGNPTSFNDTERTKIVDIWHRVAEDLAPFNIDVTTEQPASFNRLTGRVLITANESAGGGAMPYSADAGGVAYVGVFGASNYHTYYSPALVYYENLGNGFEAYVAEAASHEFGHNLNLSHDGTSTVGYYTGHGSGLVSWAPIMGVGYYQNVTQWSKGEYANANQLQDDLDIIQGYLGLAADDHGNTYAGGTALLVGGDGSVVASNPELDPHNELPENKGIINTRTDVDVFTFQAGAGPLSLTVTPAWDAFYRATSNRGANLDLSIELRTSGGSLISASDPNNDTQATVSANLAAGGYQLVVTGVGNTVSPYSDYGSLGMYFINGTVAPAVADETAPTPNPMTWASPPSALSDNAIAMTATTAVDETTTVQYRFNCIAGGSGCTSSAWQASPSYTASGLAADTSYTFTVAARDLSLNQTAASAPASATTDSPPPYVDYVANSGLLVSGSATGAVGNTYSDDGSTQSITEQESGGKPNSRYSYLEYRWTFNVSTGASVTVFANAWSSGSTDGDTFNFQYSTTGGSSWTNLFNVSSTSSGNDVSAAIAGAPSGSILVRVIDSNRSAGSRQLNTVYVDHLYIQVANPPSDPPDANPSGLAAVAVSSSQINLTWNDNSSNESGFKVESSLNGSTGWSEIADLPANAETHSNTGLVASTTYYYRVSAYNLNGSSGYSSASATTQAPPPPPAAPTGLSANGVSASQINLSWSHSGTNEDGFRVERSPAGAGDFEVVATLGVNSTSWSDTGLAASTSYDYRVAAYNGSGQALSGVATGTTDALPSLSLSANGYKQKGTIIIDLQWSGASSVDVYRNGAQIASGVGGTSYTDNTNTKGSATFQHQVCAAGGTTNCSNVTTSVF